MEVEMSYQTMIALVGEQPLPNLLPARHYQIKHACLLHTDRTQASAERLKLVLEDDQITVQLLPVDAFNIPAIVQALEACQGTWENPLIFNMTGGTKAMSFAAMQVARAVDADFCYLESASGQLQIYHHTWQNHAPQLHGPVVLNASITLEEFLRIKLGEKNQAWALKPHATGNPGYKLELDTAQSVRRHVDELMHSVSILNGQVEIDLLFRQGEQFGIVEVKDSKKSHNEGVRQLHTAGQQLGLFTRKLYVATNIKAIPAHLEPWENTGIKFVSLEYPDQTLSVNDQSKLQEAIQ
jgi:Domain of unknown function (DUF1887)